MMNRTLQYFKNIRFNPVVNKTIAKQGKQKYNAIKNHRINNFRYSTVRHMTYGSFNKPPLPPDDNILIVAAAALVCGTYFQIVKK